MSHLSTLPNHLPENNVENETKDDSRSEEDSDCNCSPIGRLPDELLLHVFSFLSTCDVKKRVALTCKRWLQVSSSTCLLDDVSFGQGQKTDVILGVLRSAPLLRRLSVFARNDANELLRELTVSNTKIVALKITTKSDWRHVEVEAEVLLEFLRVASRLRYLCLKRVTLDDPQLLFVELGSAAPGLRGLNLNHSSQVDTDRLHRLVSGLPKMRDLRLYSISYNNIGSQTPYTDTPVVDLLTRMGDTLEILKLNMMGLTGYIMPFLATSSRLTVLHLYRATGIEDDAFILLARLRKLRELVVTVPRAITASCFAELFGSAGLAGLRVLSVANSYSLDDSGLQALSSNCPELEELGLPGCRRVTAVGLTSVLASCPRLLRLNLFSVRASVAAAFVMIPLATPRLELLVYKPVDRASPDVPPELLAMPKLLIKSVYRYR